MKKLLVILAFVLSIQTAHATTWFVRADGGIRYDATWTPAGQCDGKADVAYPGSGVNQHCAYSNVQYLWDVGHGSGTFIAPAWVIAGGDTVVIRGCTAVAGESNTSNPNCRVGWSTGSGGSNLWCYAVGNNTCYNPPVPAGTGGAHTRILGGCAYDGNCSGGLTQPHLYASNLTQLFGGFDLYYTFNLQSTSYVDVAGIMITTHNKTTGGGNCTLGGSPAYPVSCQTGSQPYDDNARNGFLFNPSSTNITFTDVYAYGFSGSGFFGPIGAGISGTRVESSFNAGDAWQFDDGSDTANGAGSSWVFNYYTAIGDGCYGEYPIVHTSFPARACYDGSSAGGGGDTLSGQDSNLQTLTLNHGLFLYNTKDSFIGPHTQVTNLTVTNSYAYGMMGASWKWGLSTGANVLFQNNLTVFNCARMETAVPGAAQSFNIATGLGGSYLSAYCRAGGDGFATLSRSGSTVKIYGNTNIDLNPTVFDINCGYYTAGNVFHQETNCALAWDYQDNNDLGYTDPGVGAQSALFYFDPGMSGAITVNAQWSNQFGVRNGSTCGSNHITCVDPVMTEQPATPWPGAQSSFDVFDPYAGSANSFYPAGGSPLLAAGTALGGLTTDFYGTTRSNPPSIGGVETSGTTPTAATPTYSPVAGTYAGTQSVTLSTTSGGCNGFIVWNTTNAQTGGNLTGTSSTNPLSVAASETVYAQVQGCSGFLNSLIGSAAYVITTPTVAVPTAAPGTGTYTSTTGPITLSDATAGATICYRTDGVNPAATVAGTCDAGSSTYSSTLTFTTTTTLKMLGTKAGSTNSALATPQVYTIVAPATPSVTTSGTVTIQGNVVIQ